MMLVRVFRTVIKVVSLGRLSCQNVWGSYLVYSDYLGYYLNYVDPGHSSLVLVRLRVLPALAREWVVWAAHVLNC